MLKDAWLWKVNVCHKRSNKTQEYAYELDTFKLETIILASVKLERYAKISSLSADPVLDVAKSKLTSLEGSEFSGRRS